MDSHKMTWHVIRVYEPTLVSNGGSQAFFVYTGAALLVGSALLFGRATFPGTSRPTRGSLRKI